MSKLLKQLMMIAVAGSMMLGCSSTKQPTASEPVASDPMMMDHVASTDTQTLNYNAVYFAFNKFDINEHYSGIINANANYLSSNPNAKVTIIGGTDDIGSVAYNMALGQKRANAVKKSLIALGVHKKSIHTVSYGKNNAKYPNDDDHNRSLNRRADIVYKDAAPMGYGHDKNDLPTVDSKFYSGTAEQGIQ